MASEFTLVLYLAIFGVIAALPMVIIPLLLAPRKPTPMKLATFEAGQAPTGEARVHLMMQYYAYLLMFVIFEVVLMFLFAWGVSYVGLGVQSVPLMIIFLITIFIPMSYAVHMAGRRELW